MAKARTAAESARLLLQSGDLDGACNRAYYAVFDAARAALMASKASTETEKARTHGGLISAFSLHLVKSGILPVALGRTFNRLHEIRLIADYSGDPVERDLVESALEEAAGFVDAIQAQFFGGSQKP